MTRYFSPLEGWGEEGRGGDGGERKGGSGEEGRERRGEGREGRAWRWMVEEEKGKEGR